MSAPSDDEFRVVMDEGYRERTLFRGESLEDLLENAAEKSGRSDLLEGDPNGD